MLLIPELPRSMPSCGTTEICQISKPITFSLRYIHQIVGRSPTCPSTKKIDFGLISVSILLNLFAYPAERRSTDTSHHLPRRARLSRCLPQHHREVPSSIRPTGRHLHLCPNLVQLPPARNALPRSTRLIEIKEDCRSVVCLPQRSGLSRLTVRQ